MYRIQIRDHSFRDSVNDSDPRLPNWSSPQDAISIGQAREIIAWIREHAGPVPEEAERNLHERHPGAEIGRSAMTVEHLAKMGRASIHHEGADDRDGLVPGHGRLVSDGGYRARPGGPAHDGTKHEHAVKEALPLIGNGRTPSTVKRNLLPGWITQGNQSGRMAGFRHPVQSPTPHAVR